MVAGLDALAPQPIHHIILSAGGPVLMLPRAGLGEAVGRRVVVAWNGSREAARAVKDALPFLIAAEAVTVVAAGEDAAASLDADRGAAQAARCRRDARSRSSRVTAPVPRCSTRPQPRAPTSW